MTQIKYVFWDSDNTLVDTATQHWRKHVETLKQYGITLDEADRQIVYTNNGRQNWQWLRDERGLTVEEETYLGQIDQWYLDHIDEINMMPGIQSLLDLFQEKTLPQGVVSNGRGTSVRMALDARHISPYMAFILCKEDYEGRKPDAAPYLAGLKRMEEITGEKIDPKTCLVLEDDPKGVEAGHHAGMITIHRKLSPEQPDSPHADYCVFEEEDLISLCRELV